MLPTPQAHLRLLDVHVVPQLEKNLLLNENSNEMHWCKSMR
jgi:hypothetical protein